MLQEIQPYEFSNEFKTESMKDTDYILMYQNNSIYCKIQGNQLMVPRVGEIQHIDIEKKFKLNKCRFLFYIDDVSYYLADVELEEVGEWKYIDTQEYRYMEPAHTVYAAAVGEHLNRWYKDNKFCGRCGQVQVDSEKERALVCPSCGKITYPKICPSIIVAICDGDRILLTKYRNRPNKKHSLVAGYVEIGEGIEQTVHREVMEETGLKVKNLKYYKSQPWPFSDALLMGFFAELDGDDQITLQEDELAEAAWYNREDIPYNPSKLSLTNEMIEVFHTGKEKEIFGK